jgi:hypothetical protein
VGKCAWWAGITAAYLVSCGNFLKLLLGTGERGREAVGAAVNEKKNTHEKVEG